MSNPDFPSPGDFSPRPGEFSINTGNPAQERAERMAEFRATLFTLTPRVFVTHVLVAINVVLFLLMVVGEPKAFLTPTIQTLLNWGANFGPLTLNGQPWRIFTCMFVHIGILHLGFNMWVLWSTGMLLERMVGNVGFIVLYVVSGLCGSLASLAWNPDLVSGGASGAIFGLFGGLLGFLVLGRGSMPKEVAEQFRNTALTLIGGNLLFGFTMQGIDNAAHVGGLLGGCLCGVLLGQPVTLEAGRLRWLRNSLVVVLGVAITAGGLAAIPVPADVDEAMEHFAPIEEQAIKLYNELIQKDQTGSVTADEFVKALETEILPPWVGARERFEKLKNVPNRLQGLVAAYITYLKAREEFWRYQVQIVRTQDPSGAAGLTERDAAVGAALAEIERIATELRDGKK